MLIAVGIMPVPVSSTGSRTSIRITGLCVGEVVDVEGREAFICVLSDSLFFSSSCGFLCRFDCVHASRVVVIGVNEAWACNELGLE